MFFGLDYVKYLYDYLVRSHDPPQLPKAWKEEPGKVVNVEEKVETKKDQDYNHHYLDVKNVKLCNATCQCYPIEPDWVARALKPVQLMNLAEENSTLKLVPVDEKDDDWNSRYNERDQGSDQVG